MDQSPTTTGRPVMYAGPQTRWSALHDSFVASIFIHWLRCSRDTLTVPAEPYSDFELRAYAAKEIAIVHSTCGEGTCFSSSIVRIESLVASDVGHNHRFQPSCRELGTRTKAMVVEALESCEGITDGECEASWLPR